MIRIAAVLLVVCAALAAVPALAQFGGIFDPPRPPADVPNGAFPPQPPPVPYPQYQPPPPTAGPPPTGIQAQPLPPPPGATAAPPPVQRARIAPPPAVPPPAQPANTPPAADTPPPPPPDDTIVTEMPTEKIANNRAVFAGLDKITGRTISFDAAIGETVQFGALQVTPRVCYTRPPTEATNTDAFVEVDEVTLKGEVKRIFTGWMFAASPGLHAVEHPIYDVWLTDCAQPVNSPVAQSTAAPPSPATTPPRARQPAPARRVAKPPAAPQEAPASND